MRLSDIYRGVTGRVRAPFSDDTTGLPDAISTEMVELRDGGSFVTRNPGDECVQASGHDAVRVA